MQPRPTIVATMSEESSGASTASAFPVHELRRLFPALNGADGFVFLDNAAGTQAPQCVLNAVMNHLLERNVQRGGRYEKSRAVDATIAAARESVAALVNAWDPS